MFGRKIASPSFGFMINVIGAWQRDPNSSSLYSTCLLSWRYQICLITGTLHSKFSAVSFVANYGVLLCACCIMSKVCFLIARCDLAVHSPSSLFAFGLMRTYVILSQLEGTHLQGCLEQNHLWDPLLGNIDGNVENLSKKGPPCQNGPERLVAFLLSVVIPCVSVIFLLSSMTNNFQNLSLLLNHWGFIIYVQKQIIWGFPWSLLLEIFFSDCFDVFPVIRTTHFSVQPLLVLLIWWWIFLASLISIPGM